MNCFYKFVKKDICNNYLILILENNKKDKFLILNNYKIYPKYYNL